MAIQFNPNCTIAEILAHPRYREFARAATDHGRQVVPDAFPWNVMGRTDEEILAMPLRFQGGELMPRAQKQLMLMVIHAQEQLVREWWDWWLGWEWIANGRRPAPEHVDDEYAQAEAARAERKAVSQEGWLF
jgi:hypothetical protein